MHPELIAISVAGEEVFTSVANGIDQSCDEIAVAEDSLNSKQLEPSLEEKTEEKKAENT